MRVRTAALFVVLLTSTLTPRAASAALPAGFTEQDIAGGWNGAVAVHWDDGGRMYVVERSGKVWIVENGSKLGTPFLDISDEVGGWRDYGLLGLAFHPNYSQNHYVYLLYVVDHHHLTKFGTPNYNPATDEYFTATIGRITRYTANAATDYKTVIPASRLVLVGESASSGFPILHQSHGTGGLQFGTDGTLLAVSGDGGCYNHTDLGSDGDTYFQEGLNLGIIDTKQNIGALRSQSMSSLAGKMIRIDPETGDGLPSNPWYDVASPRSPRSRSWALGLRNPYRLNQRPATGSHNAADGDPGVFYIGDVGWSSSEDLQIVTRAGQNFGWPNFEGLTLHSGYDASNVYNRDAKNPLYGQGGCTQEFFYFRDLVKQESQSPVSFPNPCDIAQQVPDTWTDGQGKTWVYDKHVHSRPPLAWRGSAWAADWDGSGNPIVTNVGAAGSPVAGPQFSGNASTGGVWYTGTDFPAAYENTYFHADYGGGWIKNFLVDAQDQPYEIKPFHDPGAVVFVTTHPTQGGLYYVIWGESGTGRVRRISYSSGNQAPTAVAAPAVSYGPSPLTVQFDGSASSDPESQTLTYLWDFDDGASSTGQSPQHTFNPGGSAPTRYDVRLTVTDSGSLTSSADVVVSVNNTPPAVSITSPAAGTLYSMLGDETHSLAASISDLEHGPQGLSCEWQVSLFHNNHMHAEPVDTSCSTTALTSPAGCDGNTYFYRMQLSVRDAAGLATTRFVDLYPDCSNSQPHPDLSVSLTDAPDPVIAGTTLGYTATISNSGPGSASGVVLSVLLPGGATFISSNPAAPVCSVSGGSLTCNLGSLAQSASSVVSYSVQPAAAGGLSSQASVSANVERNPANNSATATTTVIAAGPGPWQSQDVGAAGLSGSAVWNGGSVTIQGGGANIGKKADAFHFVYQVLSGNGQIVARVASLQNTGTAAKAGLMIRASLNANATHALMAVTPSGGTTFLRRRTTAGTTITTTPGDGVTPPHWLRLVRSGSTLTGYKSSDGATWTEVGHQNITMATQVFIGLAVTAGNNALLTTAVFDGISLGGGGGPPANQPPTISNIPNQTILRDASTGATPFTVGDAETPAANLTLSGTSSNQTLVPSANIVFGGSGANRTVTATPAAGATGNSTISVSVSDGQSSSSDTFLLTVNGPPLPAPWQNQDIGGPGMAGSASFENGTFTVRGGGASVYGTSDQFHYVRQTLDGDGEIVARVASQDNTHLEASAGVMMRESLSANSRYAMAYLVPLGSAGFRQRAATGGATAGVGSTPAVPPHWVRLVRSGNSFSAYASPDGSSWTLLGTSTIAMAAQIYVGLDVCARDNTKLNTSVFDSVTVIP